MCVLLGACSSADDDVASGAPPPPAPAAPEVDPAAPTPAPSASPPAVSVLPGKSTYVVPQALADDASVFRLADGSVIIRLFLSPPETRNPPGRARTPAEVAAVEAAKGALAGAKPGTVLMLPASTLPRDERPRSFAADLPPGTCSAFSAKEGPRCETDPTTSTMHVPLGALPKWNGQDELFAGPNVSGGLLDLARVEAGETSIDIVGKSANLADVFEEVDASSALAAGADADGFTSVTDAFVYDFSGATIYKEGPVSLTMKTGRVELDPKIKTGLKLKGVSLQEARLAVRGDLRVEAQMELAVSTALRRSFSKDVEVTLFEASTPLPTIMVGAVPIAQSAKFTMKAMCHVDVAASARLTAGATLSESVTVGGRYDAAGFASEFALAPPTLAPVGPTFDAKAATTASCSLAPRVSVIFYGVIGPYVGLASSVNFQANAVAGPPPALAWRFGGKIVGQVGIESGLTLPGLGPVNALLSDSLKQTETELFAKEFAFTEGVAKLN